MSPGLYTEKEAEEGRIFKRSTPNESKSARPVNYPVGKPLEVRLLFKSICCFQFVVVEKWLEFGFLMKLISNSEKAIRPIGF